MDVDKLSKGQIQMLRRAFDAFEVEGKVPTNEIGTILEMLGKQQSAGNLAFLMDEFDPWNTGKLDFDTFKELAARYLTEEENPEAMQQELREAFRLYDKEGNGYITTEVLREILWELEPELSEYDLDMMIDEIDADGSGTVDFNEFMEVMTGGDE
uniref:Troponin C, isoform 1 n=1 Tax=Lygus hesperus TaxID=30085 RepID=A0A0A9YFZ5_LYGHE